MAGPSLSEEELREAAAEAGISPQELRVALAERQGTLPPTRPPSALAAATRGAPTASVEGRIVCPPKPALAAVRTAIERQIGKRGHGQGELEADIVDDESGVTYRLRSEPDGTEGALVRIDIDPSAARGTQALATTGVIGVTATIVGLGWLFGATLLWLGGLGLGVVGGLLIARGALRLRGAAAQAHAVAAHALMEAEDRTGRAMLSAPDQGR